MNSLLRVVCKNSKLNIFSQSKHLHNNSTSIRQYSINLSTRYSRRFFERNARTPETLTVLANRKLPTSLLTTSQSFATFRDDGFESDSDDDLQFDSDDDLPATVAIPEVWPHLPVIAINQPVFPRFMKIIEVSATVDVVAIASFAKILCSTNPHRYKIES